MSGLRRPFAFRDALVFRSALVLCVALLPCGTLVRAPEALAAQIAGAELVYTGEVMGPLSGGVSREAAFLGNVDAILTLDGSAAAGWEGWSAFLYVLANHGDAPSALAGDAQGVSNIEAPEAIRLYEAWVQKDMPGRGFSLLVGLYDVNSEFDVVDEAGVFLNSSFGIGAEYAASGVLGPSIFPVTSLGLRLKWRPTGHSYVQAAVLDGVPGDPADPRATAVHLSSSDGALLAFEVGYRLHPGEPGAGHPATAPGGFSGIVGRGFDVRDVGKVAAGLWAYTRAFDRLDRLADDGSPERVLIRPGVYFLAGGAVRREEDPSQGLAVFGRAGWADPRVHRFNAYTGAGLVYTGLLPGRDADRLGLGVAAAHNGSAYRRAEAAAGRAVTDMEVVVELTYRVALVGTLAVQPDLQWVIHPDTDPEAPDVLLAGLRVEVGF